MRMMFGLVLVVGLALAGFAVYMAQGYIGRTQAELAREKAMRVKMGPIVEAYVVNKPLNYGDPLTKDDVQLVFMQESALPEGAFKTEEELFPNEGKDPRFVLRQMEKFEPLMAIKLTEPGEAAGLTGMLDAGQRAFTIQFDDAAGASRYLQPGNFVDVFWSGSSDQGEQITQLIEQAVSIIAVDRATGKNAETMAPKTLTVAATPEQVARLTQGQSTGQLSVALVGKTAERVDETLDTRNCTLLGNCAAPVEVQAAVEEPQQCFVWMTKAGERVQVPIPCTN